MKPQFETALSTHDDRSITVRELDLASEVMDEMDFATTLFYLWTGNVPTAGERRVVDAILTSLLVHGTTPSAIASRLTVLTEPDAMQAAVASGILGVGSRYVGTMQGCSEILHELAEAEDTDAAVATLVAEHLRTGERFPGIGHPQLTPVDPRAERLFDIATEEGIAGEHVDLLHRVREGFEAETGADLPINVTGAIAAVTADVGLSPAAARGLAVLSRAGGVVGEILEEQERPIASDIWHAVDASTKRPDDG